MGYTHQHPVYAKLRNAILKGEKLPGSRLKIEPISHSYNSSTVPVREALTRLTAEGLVQYDHGHGFMVREFSVAELEDSYRLIGMLICEGVQQLSKLSTDRLKYLISNSLGEDIAILQNNKNCSECSARVLFRLGNILFTPAVERHFIGFLLIVEPFRNSTSDLCSASMQLDYFLRNLLNAILSANFSQATLISQTYFLERDKTLTEHFSIYIRSLKSEK